MYYQIKNMEAFINNNTIKVVELGNKYITPEMRDILMNNLNMEMHPSPDQNTEKLLKDILVKYGKDQSDINNDISKYSELIRGIHHESNVSIYSINENGDIFKELSVDKLTSSSDGDWTNLEPLVSPVKSDIAESDAIYTRRSILVIRDPSVNITDEMVAKC
jgi:hypothetical protein